MKCFTSRAVVASFTVLVLIALIVLAAPAAQAAPRDRDLASSHLDRPWVQVFLIWLGLAPAAGAAHPPIAAVRKSGDGSVPGGHLIPLTGSCIDPQGGGGPRCGS